MHLKTDVLLDGLDEIELTKCPTFAAVKSLVVV